MDTPVPMRTTKVSTTGGDAADTSNTEGANVTQNAEKQNSTCTGDSNGGKEGDNTGDVVPPQEGDANLELTSTVVWHPLGAIRGLQQVKSMNICLQIATGRTRKRTNIIFPKCSQSLTSLHLSSMLSFMISRSQL